MILFVDDEEARSLRWREALEELGERCEVRYRRSAEEALQDIADVATMKEVELVVLDLAMYTTGGLTDADTGFGRLTGMAVRKRLRATGWRGPLVILSNSRDDVVRDQVERAGDTFVRKLDNLPSDLKKIVCDVLKIT